MAQQKKRTEVSNFLATLMKPTHVNKTINLQSLPVTLPDGKVLVMYSGSYKANKDVQGFELSLAILKSNGMVVCPQLTLRVYMRSSDTSVIYIEILRGEENSEVLTSSSTSALKSSSLLKDYTAFKSVVVSLINELRISLPNPVLYGWR